MSKEKIANFIKTQDLTTAEGLTWAGFKLFEYKDSTWIFINNPEIPITFSHDKMTYDNKLTF